ncbi:hypothetical protein AJ79_05201 [Helicocarpus griseus UAMH5409]|uniref:ARB-07466-like C-terminal domain-containing protein n=1 Tax=Helicocarpus griseus UAMH5409 TaxID=1447875 RepID=A0A2B7XPS0_9EURO|nr:hypothetical protein AJ79_05201 [Helicocarpus griseus UAMH5409]
MKYLLSLLALTATCTSLSAKSRRWELCDVQGEPGTCLPPAECKAWNGVPVAGNWCSNSPDGWQCCTKKLPPADGSNTPAPAPAPSANASTDADPVLTKRRAPRSCNVGGIKGICIKKSDCKGTATPGAGTKADPWTCPRDPNDVWCCTDKKPPGPKGKKCNARGVPGVCMKKSACKGIATPGAGTANDPYTCPNDPNDVMCCTDKKPPPPPPGPAVKIPESKCKRHVIDAGYKILNANPGKVKSVGCYGKRSGTSDHPKGLALDFMTEVRSHKGQQLAEYVMRHAGGLKVKYVIWGQKIWDMGEKVRPWAQWEKMEDRGGVTANHW